MISRPERLLRCREYTNVLYGANITNQNRTKLHSQARETPFWRESVPVSESVRGHTPPRPSPRPLVANFTPVESGKFQLVGRCSYGGRPRGGGHEIRQKSLRTCLALQVHLRLKFRCRLLLIGLFSLEDIGDLLFKIYLGYDLRWFWQTNDFIILQENFFVHYCVQVLKGKTVEFGTSQLYVSG